MHFEIFAVTDGSDSGGETVADAAEHGVDVTPVGARGRGGFRRVRPDSATGEGDRTASVPVSSVRAVENDGEADGVGGESR